MRLRKIKLSGFKSFVDPTTLIVPHNLTGIVGPNGCGKSNIIDAVMWVMGESSAKHLRGDALTDVIFNGSSARNPVGHAAVELIFDNTENKLGGQYASYDEISIKRQINREAISTYYLNGARCRRRDITAIFLGTGLGPRSYAIIEQGMISRLIEAKPEELRTYIEEAAGISKYKERRRETENRIRNTRENIARLSDILDELGKQLKHLQRQANAAERYQTLKQEQRQLEAEVQALNWRVLKASSEDQEQAIREQENKLEAAVADQRHVENEIVHKRESLTAANEHFNQVQTDSYELGAAISQLEQKIQHVNERVNDIRHSLKRIDQEGEQIKTQMAQDRQQYEELQESGAGLEPMLRGSRQESDKAYTFLTQSEQAMQKWQSEWENYNSAATDYSRRLDVARMRLEHLEAGIEDAKQREHNLEHQRAEIDIDEMERLLADERNQLEQASRKRLKIENELADKRGALVAQREALHSQSEALNELSSQCQKLEGSLASLQALQEAAFTEDQGEVNDWLKRQELSDAPRLAQKITADTKWMSAVEVVLKDHLQDVCVDNALDYVPEMPKISEGQVGLVSISEQVDSDRAGRFPSLADKVDDDFPLRHLLSEVYLADDLEAAVAMRSNLIGTESVITPSGFRVGPNWLRLTKPGNDQTGVINRERQIQTLRQEIRKVTEARGEAESRLNEARTELQTLEQDLHGLQNRLNEQQHQIAEIKANVTTREASLEQARERKRDISEELEQLHDQQEEDKQEMDAIQVETSQLESSYRTLEAQHGELTKFREEHQLTLKTARERWQKTHEESHGIALQLESITSQRASLEQSIKRNEVQLAHLASRHEELERSLEENQSPIAGMQNDLEEKLASKVEGERRLSEARAAVERLDGSLRELEQLRTGHEQRVQTLRSELEQSRISHHETTVRLKTIEEHLEESSIELQQVLAALSDEAEISLWREKLEKINQRIQRLGPINLAAIDEFNQISERKNYLDQQNKDLHEALRTLENAIEKIDKESRNRFKQTFDQLNANLQELFPQLFGGGMSYLELTGDDLLETGVTIMARPPGKRNSTIHLLSGGEKALTAVALVFSIFKLNPAPFCILDEVDAPLDDANVGRFSDLVSSMSEEIQFIFITHNKITMEIAHQLLGVTMLEAGVSRLVSVDVDEAVKMAATA